MCFAFILNNFKFAEKLQISFKEFTYTPQSAASIINIVHNPDTFVKILRKQDWIGTLLVAKLKSLFGLHSTVHYFVVSGCSPGIQIVFNHHVSLDSSGL